MNSGQSSSHRLPEGVANVVETVMQDNRHSKSDGNAWMIGGGMECWMMWLLSDCNGKWISTRCEMVHGWPHENSEHCVSKDLGLTDQGCFGTKQGRWSDESTVGCR